MLINFHWFSNGVLSCIFCVLLRFFSHVGICLIFFFFTLHLSLSVLLFSIFCFVDLQVFAGISAFLFFLPQLSALCCIC